MGPERTLALVAANGGFEPDVPDAACRLNVCFSQSARTSLRQTAAELSARGIKAAPGGKRLATRVRSTLAAENVGLSCL